MINVMQLVQMAQRGQSPMGMIGQMMEQNPALRSAMQMLEGKTQQQQMTMLQNMAKERGTTLEAIAQQMGLPLK